MPGSALSASIRPFLVLICYPGTCDVRTEVCQREHSHEVFFFSLSFQKSQLFQGRSPRAVQFFVLPLPSCPFPNPRTLRSIFALPHAHKLPLWQEAIRQLSFQGGLPPRGQGSVLFVILFSANTRTEKPRSTHKQIQSKETETVI